MEESAQPSRQGDGETVAGLGLGLLAGFLVLWVPGFFDGTSPAFALGATLIMLFAGIALGVFIPSHSRTFFGFGVGVLPPAALFLFFQFALAGVGS